jgi:predicted AlkP superfamily pyrophosphatase or phosphodiesterase
VIADERHLRFFNDGEVLGYLQVDKEVFDHAIATIKTESPDLSFVYFCGVDEAGHKHGANVEQYFEAAERIDKYVSEIYQTLIGTGEEWLLVIVTDHGHRDEGGHGGDSAQERASFILAHGINRPHPDWPRDLEPHQLSARLLEHL